MSGAPLTDSRRAQKLRAALAQMAPWLAPEWAGFGQKGDFGAALYEIAARLAEHSTRRLDQTALRDQLSFLRTLDIAGPAPRSATVPIVFMLAEKRSEPVYAPPRVQVAAAGETEPVIFETCEGLAISPARPLRLIVADPGSDRIELAPANVIAAPERALPPVTYRLVSAAEPEGTTLQLAQAVGLAAGDLLRIGGIAYRVAKRSGEIVTLLDPLETAAPAGAAIEKVSRLEAFTLRNLREHLVYLGHKELLKLDGAATISLRFKPPSLARRLARLDIAYDLWGKCKLTGVTDWHELRLLGSRDGDLRLRKDWEGPVEEVEAEARKSRWIRLRLQSPISDADPPDTRAAEVAITVRSSAAKAKPPEGSGSIVSAFYNGLPLPLTTAFLPFGAEPQRFDTFAIAAPEALSKKGATVELTVALSDASLGSIAATAGAPKRLYGIGRNGRLQAIRFDPPAAVRWRQLDRPPPPASGSGAAARLDPAAACYAWQAQAGPPATDVVVVRDAAKAWWSATVNWDGQDWSVSKWAILPPPGEAPADSLCLVYTQGRGQLDTAPSPPPTALLVASDAAGLHMQALDPAGAPRGWQTPNLAPGSDPAPAAPLLLAPVDGGSGLLVAIDAEGAVYRGKIDSHSIAWSKVPGSEAANAATRPAAVLQGGKLRVVIATRSAARPLAMLREENTTLYPPAAELGAAGAPVSIACLPTPATGAGFPLVAVVGQGRAMVWSGRRQAVTVPVPSEGDPATVCSLLATASGTGARLVLGSPNERLLHAPIESAERSLAFVAHDALLVGAGEKPKFILIDRQLPPVAAEAVPIAVGGALLLPVRPGLVASGQRYALLSAVRGGSGTGARSTKWPTRLGLDLGDAATAKGDLLKIGEGFFEVDSIAAKRVRGRRIATLKTDVPAGALKYVAFRPGEEETLVARDEQTLLSFAAASLPDDVADLGFAADPEVQSFAHAAVQPAGETWVRVDEAWSTPPADGQATFFMRWSVGAWTQVPLPRSIENPELSWEYFDGRGWRRLDKKFSDRTANLASSGSVCFTVPDDLSPTDVAGKQDYWIRARLVGGDYGRAAYVVKTEPPNRQSISIDRSGVNPPEIVTIEASYTLQSYRPPEIVLTVNNLAPVDQTQAAAADGAEFELFEGLAAHTGDAEGLGRAIYLGLTRAPGVAALSLYVDAVDVDAPALLLQAEVLRPEGWAPILSEDGTAGLARPGLLRFFLSTAPAQLRLFGCDGWWLRLRPVEPTSQWAPILRGLYLNAVTAEQAKSLRQEILGSSLGEPGQSYTLAEAPVLPGTLELRVRESLSDEEKVALTSDDPEAVASYPDIEGEWIRWRATDSFVDEDGGARVFRMDPSTGEVRFGDGRSGMIPPAGRDSIRATGYQAFGGSRGNVRAFAADQLKTALESVELAVNPVDAGGGADSPPGSRLVETAPARLRHAALALTPPDVEALATGSSPDVVRARCLRGRGCGIDLVVAIRQTGERCPVPSRGRREGFARDIAEAGWGALAAEDIRVRGPRYVHVRVEAVVIAASAEGAAGVENEVRRAIADFLHPMDGGPRGLGWPFGRRPWPSEVQRVAQAVAGVDRAVDVVIAPRDAGADLDRLGADCIVCAEEDDIRLTVQPPRGVR